MSPADRRGRPCNRFIVIVGQLHQQGLVRRACNEQRRYMLRGNRQHDLIKAFETLATGQQPAIAVTLQGADPCRQADFTTVRGYVVCCRLRKQAPEICFRQQHVGGVTSAAEAVAQHVRETCADACRGAVLSAARQSGSQR